MGRLSELVSLHWHGGVLAKKLRQHEENERGSVELKVKQGVAASLSGREPPLA